VTTSKSNPTPARVVLFEQGPGLRLVRVRKPGGLVCRLELRAGTGRDAPVQIEDPEVARRLGWALYEWSMDPAGREEVT
jgi:hypothetical protein